MVFFVDVAGCLILVRLCPRLKELLFQEGAPNAIFLIVCLCFCRWDVGRSQNKTCKPAKVWKGEMISLEMEKTLQMWGGSRQLSRADVRVRLETVQVTPEAVEWATVSCKIESEEWQKDDDTPDLLPCLIFLSVFSPSYTSNSCSFWRPSAESCD